MPVHPQAQAILDMLAAQSSPPFRTLTPDDARALVKSAPPGPPPPEVAQIEERTIPGPGGEIPVRIYTPEGPAPFPVLVYFHGGGWVVCDLDTHDGICRALSNAAGCLTVSVDYRLAPEHKYPAAAEDAYAATQWVAAHAAAIGGDPTRTTIGGDSAGGNLAAVVALMARDRGGPPIALQALVYPVTDFNFESPSYRENGEGYLLTRESMIWFWDHYLVDRAQGREPYASPLRATALEGLPPALVITAEYDPLRDEGEAYGARLAAAGVPTTTTRYDGMIHGFFTAVGTMDASATAIDEVAAALRRAFAA